MAKQIHWVIPSKHRRDAVKPHTMYWDNYLITAAREIADEQSKILGRRMSSAIILTNLATQRGEYWTELRRRLKKRTEQLKKEDTHHVNHTQTTQESLDAEVQQEWPDHT